MEIIIDDELKPLITEDWVKNALEPVDPDMLTDLTIKIIDPSNCDKYHEAFDSGVYDPDDEELMEELSRRMTLGLCPAIKIAEIYLRRGAWVYYTVRRTIILTLFHEIYHANDPDLNEEWTPSILESPYRDHPREIRARKFAMKTFQQLRDKRKIIMTNAEVKA